MKIGNKRCGSLFIEKSIASALDFFKEAVYSEDMARSKGFMQSIRPPLKIVFLAAFILTACLVNSIPALAFMYALSVGFAVISGINLLFFMRRVWIFIPVFTLFIALPAALTGNFFSAALFVLRVVTCVSFVILTTLTTRHHELLRSLRSFGIPSIFLQVLDMTYRYIFLFIKTFEEMHIGLKARLIGEMGTSNARRWVASRMGHLFRRSSKLGEDVYMAMIARGYTGGDEKDER